MITKDQILDCVPLGEGSTAYASDIYKELCLTDYRKEPERMEVRRVLRNAIDKGEIKTNSKFGLYRNQ